MNQKSEIDLLLIGKTGNGKSAVGNSILDRRVFESSGSTTSVTRKIDYEVSEVNGRVIKVVDTPGVCDTTSDKQSADKLVMDALEKAIATNPKGYHAMLLVVKYGGRFTGEEQAGIKYLKTLFGENFVKDYGILIVTGGDTFEFDNQRHGIPFEKWCRQQIGAFKELYEECDRRAVLFNNISADKSVKSNQVKQLITVVDQLKSRGKRYTNQAFEKARESRAKVFVRSNTILVKDETIRELSLILQKLRQIQESEEPSRELGNAETLLIRVEALSDNISGLDRGSGEYHSMVNAVKNIKAHVAKEIKEIYRAQECQRNMREEQMRILEVQRQMQEYERRVEKKLEREKQEELLRKQNELKKKEIQMQRDMVKRAEQIRNDAEKKKQQDEMYAMEQNYLDLKRKTDEGVLTKIVLGVTKPFRMLGDWLFS